MASENDTGSVDAGEEPTTTEVAAPARVDGPRSDLGATEHRAPKPLAPQRYKVQFTATEEYVRLVEEAKALLSHAAPRVTLDEIHLRALRTFVALLRKQKYATEDAPSRQTQSAASGELSRSQPETEPPDHESEPAKAGTEARHSRQRRQRGRHIPAAVRRVVFARDGEQCTYVDATGQRCSETHLLEFHHLEPFALGGEHTAENVALQRARGGGRSRARAHRSRQGKASLTLLALFHRMI
jgi:hypothetical protein